MPSESLARSPSVSIGAAILSLVAVPLLVRGTRVVWPLGVRALLQSPVVWGFVSLGVLSARAAGVARLQDASQPGRGRSTPAEAPHWERFAESPFCDDGACAGSAASGH